MHAETAARILAGLDSGGKQEAIAAEVGCHTGLVSYYKVRWWRSPWWKDEKVRRQAWR